MSEKNPGSSLMRTGRSTGMYWRVFDSIFRPDCSIGRSDASHCGSTQTTVCIPHRVPALVSSVWVVHQEVVSCDPALDGDRHDEQRRFVSDASVCHPDRDERDEPIGTGDDGVSIPSDSGDLEDSDGLAFGRHLIMDPQAAQRRDRGVGWVFGARVVDDSLGVLC